MSRTRRMPRIDELPLPAQNQICAAQHKERDDDHPDEHPRALVQRLASVGLGPKAKEDEPNGTCDSINEDNLDIPAFLRRPVTS